MSNNLDRGWWLVLITCLLFVSCERQQNFYFRNPCSDRMVTAKQTGVDGITKSPLVVFEGKTFVVYPEETKPFGWTCADLFMTSLASGLDVNEYESNAVFRRWIQSNFGLDIKLYKSDSKYKAFVDSVARAQVGITQP